MRHNCLPKLIAAAACAAVLFIHTSLSWAAEPLSKEKAPAKKVAAPPPAARPGTVPATAAKPVSPGTPNGGAPGVELPARPGGNSAAAKAAQAHEASKLTARHCCDPNLIAESKCRMKCCQDAGKAGRICVGCHPPGEKAVSQLPASAPKK